MGNIHSWSLKYNIYVFTHDYFCQYMPHIYQNHVHLPNDNHQYMFVSINPNIYCDIMTYAHLTLHPSISILRLGCCSCPNQSYVIWSAWLTHRGPVMHLYIGNLARHWFRQWLVACSAPSHYLNQCWLNVKWTLRNKLQCKLPPPPPPPPRKKTPKPPKNKQWFSFKKTHLNIWKMLTILSWP